MRSHRHVPMEEHTGIDLAPMLDFVLNLLIFFIITTTFVKEAGVIVNRPPAVTATAKDKANVMVAIRPNGEVWVDKKPIDIRMLRPYIERAHAERPDDTVIIIADKDSTSGMLKDVMDQIKAGGIETIAVSAEEPSQ
jgi:biopolymer transport protein ExbD